MTKSFNEKDSELVYLRKRERLFTVEKKMIETVQTKTTTMASKLENKEHLVHTLNDQVGVSEKEAAKWRDRVKELERDVEKLKKEVQSANEKADLFKEMAVICTIFK